MTAVKATTRVESFEALEWFPDTLPGMTTAIAGENSGCSAWRDGSPYAAHAAIGAVVACRYGLGSLAAAKRAAWDLLLELRAKAAPVKLATDLPAPRDLTPAEMAEAAAEGRAVREALDRATVGMEGAVATSTNAAWPDIEARMRAAGVVRVSLPYAGRVTLSCRANGMAYTVSRQSLLAAIGAADAELIERTAIVGEYAKPEPVDAGLESARRGT